MDGLVRYFNFLWILFGLVTLDSIGSAEVISCTSDTKQCVGCRDDTINISCPKNYVVVIDDVISLYSTGDTENVCEENITCNSTSAAQSQVNQCNQGESSLCDITVSPWTMQNIDCFMMQLSRAYVHFRCVSVAHRTQESDPGQCMACNGGTINIACPNDHTIVIDDVTSSYGFRGTDPNTCEETIMCNSTTAAVSQVNSCTWQHSSCNITVSSFTMIAFDCPLNLRLLRAYAHFHCVPKSKILNFGLSLRKEIEFRCVNDEFYLLSPCYPRHYSNCEYYELNTEGIVGITNLLRSPVQISSVDMERCELEIIANDATKYSSVCADLETYNTSINGHYFSITFIGARKERRGFLLQLSEITSVTQMSRNDNSSGISKSAMIAMGTAIALVCLILGALIATAVVLFRLKSRPHAVPDNSQFAYEHGIQTAENDAHNTSGSALADTNPNEQNELYPGASV